MTSIRETIVLNATTAYLKKSVIKATADGYVEESNINLGQYIKAGMTLFSIKTKEAQALDNMDNKDSLFGIGGLITVSAPVSGNITALYTQANSYVNDGDPMAVLADLKSFVFILHVPFEQKEYAKKGTTCEISLPDASRIRGIITSRLSEVDPGSQTWSYVIIPQTNPSLPENLIVTVELEKSVKPNTQVVNKSCVLSDETMENFWVMKLINDTVAVKVPVIRGISTDSSIEILAPAFQPGDRLINSGNYGLPDTARISINQ
jgi:hypothetical protein